MRLRRSSPAKVERYENVITQIGLKVNDPDLFIRVQEACLKKRAFLFEGPEGFIVLRPLSEGVLLWVTFTNRKADLHSYQKEFEMLTRDIGGKFLEFWTVRPGFKKVANRLGYSPSPNEWNGVPITVWRKPL